MRQDRSPTSRWTETAQGPAEGALLPEEFDSLGNKSQGWWQGMRQSLLRHPEHPLSPGKLCREPGDQGLQSSGTAGAVCAPCHTSSVSPEGVARLLEG